MYGKNNFIANVNLQRKGLLFIISAPSGVGKSTLINHVVSRMDNLKFLISVTTRNRRVDEVDGINYFFKTREEFYKLIEAGAFLEYAEVYGNFYGTLKEGLINNLNAGYDVVTDLDHQGATLIKDSLPKDTLTIYVLPPSIDELERRIKQRNKDTEDIIKYRMAKSRSEINLFYKYDYLVFNNNLDTAVDNICSIIQANRNRIDRINNINEIIKFY